jgi:excisionase family DNA binding protein
MQAKQILTTGEIAKYCGVNFRTVIRWIERGRLKAYQLPGRGDNRVTVEDFMEFLRINNMPVPEDFTHKDRRVLIVESDLNVARQVEGTLQQSGFQTSIASDGFHAGSLLGTFRPSVMLLDLKIPGLSAKDVVSFVRKAGGSERVKVVLVASDSLSNEVDSVKTSGADDFLRRPFSNDELVAKVNQLLEPAYS